MKSSYPEPKYLSVPDAAKYCGVSRNTVYTWVRKGKLGAYQTPGKTNLIRPSDLVRFMHASGLFVPPGLTELGHEDEKLLGPNVPPTQTTAKLAHPDLHILAVDDDPLTRSFYARGLQNFCKLTLAETGFEALHLITTHPGISLVMLDLRMPGQHGMKTFREIRQLNPNLPVIVVSGFAEDWMPGLAGGTVEVIRKPFEPADIQKAALRIVKDRNPA
jgi:excisionase family DNA binding protein